MVMICMTAIYFSVFTNVEFDIFNVIQKIMITYDTGLLGK